MGYAEALALQANIADFYQSKAGRRYALWATMPSELRDLFPEGDGDWESLAAPYRDEADRWRGDLLNWAQAAETFYVSAPIGRLLVDAAADLPPTPLDVQRVFSRHGFISFESPLSDGPNPKFGQILAIGWEAAWAYDRETYQRRPSGDWLYLRVFNRSERGDTPGALLAGDRWNAGETFDEVADEWEKGRYFVTRLRRLMMAFFEFIGQRVLVAEPRAVLNRGVRKRLMRTFPHEPLVRVIELRRREYQQRDESAHVPVEWSCRWLVRGHWRNQPYKDGHRPKWIMPHVKGPDDRPFKPPRATVYEVVR